MTGTTDVFRAFIRIDQRLYRERPLKGRYSGCYFEGVDRYGKGGAMGIRVLADHRSDSQLVEPFSLHGNADQSPGIFGHEIDGFRSRPGSGNHQVSFIFPVFIIDHDNHPAFPDVFHRFFNGAELECHAEFSPF